MGVFVIIGLLLLGDVIAWAASVRWLRRHSAGRRALWLAHAFFGVQTLYVLAMIVLMNFPGGRRAMDWLPAWGQALIYIWHLVCMPLGVAMWLGIGATMAVKRVFDLLARPREQEAIEDSQATPMADGMSRRSLLLASVAAVPPLLAVSATGYSLHSASRFRLSRMHLPVAGLPPALEGFRIAHLTDLHVGRWSTRAFLDEVVQTTNLLNADVVLFTGDLLDISISDLPPAIDTIKRLRSRHGVYMIEGNHDLIDNGAMFRHAVLHEGLNFLRSSIAKLEHNGQLLELLGLPWSRSELMMQQDVMALASMRDRGAFPILLAHHPHAFDAAADARLPLTLAGHTHGGQLALTRDINAGNMLFRYVSGLYRKGDSQLLVSNGTGNWFPLRMGAPAEIIEITLVGA